MVTKIKYEVNVPKLPIHSIIMSIYYMIGLKGKIAVALYLYYYDIKKAMQDNSLEAKKEYLNKMSQHFKEIADRQYNNETQRVIANTLSKNADIMTDIYSLIETLTMELREVKNENERLRQMVSQMNK
jgi:hypothetical protein